MFGTDARLSGFNIKSRTLIAADDKGIISQVVGKNQLNAANVNNFWYWNIASIKSSTAALKKDAILVVRMAITSDGSIRGGCLLIEGDQQRSFDVTASNIDQFMQRAMSSLAQKWSEQDAISLQLSDNEQLIIVDGIKSHQDYTQMISYLEAMDIVEQVYVVQAEAQRLSLAVSLKTTSEQFERSLLLTKKLLPQTNAPSPFSYRWQ